MKHKFLACGRLWILTLLPCLFLSCGRVEKQITVITREAGSGTREAFDRAVSDGVHALEERDEEGKRIYRTVKTAIQQTKTGAILSLVASDPNAIGYLSPEAVNASVRVVSVNGVMPTEEAVRSGAYPIQRPFVIMTREDQTLTPLASDFFLYLQSDRIRDHARAAGCVFLEDEAARAGMGKSPIPVIAFEKKDPFPKGDRIVIRGSSSMERLIFEAAKGYASLYGENAETLFDIQLEGSSVGVRAVEQDRVGNVIGLSSAEVDRDGILTLRVCADAVAVVVNANNPWVKNLTTAQLYGIFSGSVKYFRELEGKT